MQTSKRAAFSPPERLIVAADFTPAEMRFGGIEWARGEVLRLADSIADTGVYLKVNSVLRAVGYGLIRDIKHRGLRVFADLKLIDIPSTLANDGAFLREAHPELVTVACATGIEAMRALQGALPETEVLGVTVLTSLDETDVNAMFSCSTPDAVARLADFAKEAGLKGLISSPAEAAILRGRMGVLMSINTPAIRPTWSVVKGDDQNLDRVMTPAKAIAAGADRIVIGRPITGHVDPYVAVRLTLDEIEQATT